MINVIDSRYICWTRAVIWSYLALAWLYKSLNLSRFSCRSSNRTQDALDWALVLLVGGYVENLMVLRQNVRTTSWLPLCEKWGCFGIEDKLFPIRGLIHHCLIRRWITSQSRMEPTGSTLTGVVWEVLMAGSTQVCSVGNLTRVSPHSLILECGWSKFILL